MCYQKTSILQLKSCKKDKKKYPTDYKVVSWKWYRSNFKVVLKS